MEKKFSIKFRFNKEKLKNSIYGGRFKHSTMISLNRHKDINIFQRYFWMLYFMENEKEKGNVQYGLKV